MPNETDLKNTLNSIYKQSVVKWEVATGTPLTNIAFEGDKMSHGGSGITSPYNTDQKTLINTYDDTYELEDNARYLFFVSEVVDRSANIAGYMPLKYQCGFIYGLPNNNTIAHELGHGTFNLYHTFSPENNIAPEGTTQNLMDYAGGTELWHYQWDLIYDPESMAFAWAQDESEAEMGASKVIEILTAIKKSLTNHEPVELSCGKDVYNTANNIYLPAEIKNIAIKSLKNISSINITPEQIVKSERTPYNTHYDIIIGESFRISFIVEKERNLVFNWLLRKGNAILFVNGYRFGQDNKPTNNQITTADNYNYWSDIYNKFATQLMSSAIYYADGHMGISTSNHENFNDFYCSAKSVISAFPSSMTEAGLKYGSSVAELIVGFPAAIVIAAYDVNCVINGAKLNTEPNKEGFTKRYEQGKIAGENQLALIKSNTHINKNENGDILDTLDIVCHSMGYAYALGMIESLKGKIPFNGLYIIAPENAESGYIPAGFKQVWQYGSNETEPIDKQDGVAPQKAIPGINDRRAYIPSDGTVPRGFISSHSISNYGWIFNLPKIEKGYVTPRE